MGAGECVPLGRLCPEEGGEEALLPALPLYCAHQGMPCESNQQNRPHPGLRNPDSRIVEEYISAAESTQPRVRRHLLQPRPCPITTALCSCSVPSRPQAPAHWEGSEGTRIRECCTGERSQIISFSFPYSMND